ncbi:MAG: hypothetical protein PHG96_08385 [Kiritimatiellae bacterium]|nr:hypothetical protein [Kiritimatiellia bacterium]MDD4622423.1 hypothetical protein [Kiritimatiellia bacterium]
MIPDHDLVETFLTPVRICSAYRPAFGSSNSEGVDLPAFQKLYENDPFYAWIGLNDPLVYTAHKMAGGLTSVYRQIGVGTEHLLRAIIRDSLGLTAEETTWSYRYRKPNGKTGVHSLDAKISFADLSDAQRRIFIEWMEVVGPHVDLTPAKRKRIQGVVFEIRQGYKSADSKRQNADLRFGMSAYQEGLLPAFMILSQQVSETVIDRYRKDKMAVLTGTLGGDSLSSTFTFFKQVVGFDLESFFRRNSEKLKTETLTIIQSLLCAN